MNGDFELVPFGIFAIVAVIIVAVAIASYLAAARRRNELQQLALSRGWMFCPVDMSNIPSTYGYFGLFDQGHSRKAYNVISGRFDDMEFEAFDYRYTTGSGKNRQVHELSAAVARARFPLKPISIRPENFLDRVAGAFGFEDVDFEWDQFNRAFYVKCADKRFAYDVITQKMMEFLMENRGWRIEIFADRMLVYNDDTLSCDGFLDALNFTNTFLSLLPAYLADRLRSE